MRTITSLVTTSGIQVLWVILHQGKKKISTGWDEEGCSIKQDYTRAMRMRGCEWVRHRAGWRRLRTCRGSWSGEVGKMQMEAWFEMMNLNESQRWRVKMRNREGSGNDLLNRRHHDHSLGSEVHPVQEYPWQNQHNYADGKTKHEPVPKINNGAIWVVPEEM